jgi:hypothetical protein
MWKNRSQELKLKALASMPNHGIDLTGHWAGCQETSQGDFLWGVQLQQYGTAVFGSMQSKLAAYHPLELQGILIGRKLFAHYWRPHKHGTGAGLLELELQNGDHVLTGSASWYGEDNEGAELRFRWERTQANT